MQHFLLNKSRKLFSMSNKQENLLHIQHPSTEQLNQREQQLFYLQLHHWRHHMSLPVGQTGFKLRAGSGCDAVTKPIITELSHSTMETNWSDQKRSELNERMWSPLRGRDRRRAGRPEGSCSPAVCAFSDGSDWNAEPREAVRSSYSQTE